MTDDSKQADNIFLSGSLPLLFVKTAAPIIIVMVVNGLFTLVDAYFLGRYVGAEALTAVTLMFPIYMVLIASSTLVGNGFSSIYARLLGARDRWEAAVAFAQALQLSLVICVVLIIGFVVIGDALILGIAKGSAALAGHGYTYIAILIFCSPLVFVLAINIDALRCEGLLAAMAAITMMSALLNILFDYLFIAEFGWGVAGSAWGTVAAQICSFSAVLLFRLRQGGGTLGGFVTRPAGTRHWRPLIALGAPTSLGYVGVALSSGLTIYCLQLWAGSTYEATAGAYGIITRLMTFMFLPLLGLSLGFQTIVGNNYGARDWGRANHSIKIAILAAFIYTASVEAILIFSRSNIGFLFVSDTAIAAEIGRILPLVTALLFLFGPLMMISTYFQAIGDASRAALLGLSRTYLFGLPLTFTLPFWIGEVGIWYAGIVAELLVLLLTIAVLIQRSRSGVARWGLFQLQPDLRS